MRFSCKSCLATFQTATGAPAAATFRCPSCGGEMAAVAEVVDLWQDRIPTRRYDLDDLRQRLDHEREEAAKTRTAPRTPDQVWFAAVQGRQIGPLSTAGIAGLRARGQLSAASLVWREGWPAWVAAEAVSELRTILGLPEEKPGQPFPVAPAAPAPPPIDATYPGARGGEVGLADAAALFNQKTDPEARVPAGLAQLLESTALPAAPGAELRAQAAAPMPFEPLATAPGAAARDEKPAAERTTPPIPPIPVEVPAPPALPRADELELEQAASAVFAEVRAGQREGARPLDDARGTGGREEPAASAPEAVPAPQEPAASEPSPPPASDAAPAAHAARDAVTQPPLPMIDLSAPSSEPDPLAPARRSRRPAAQQQWFGAAEEPSSPPFRPRAVLVAALVVALIAIALALHRH